MRSFRPNDLQSGDAELDFDLLFILATLLRDPSVPHRQQLIWKPTKCSVGEVIDVENEFTDGRMDDLAMKFFSRRIENWFEIDRKLSTRNIYRWRSRTHKQLWNRRESEDEKKFQTDFVIVVLTDVAQYWQVELSRVDQESKILILPVTLQYGDAGSTPP